MSNYILHIQCVTIVNMRLYALTRIWGLLPFLQTTTNELKSVLPALTKATMALTALDKADVAELR